MHLLDIPEPRPTRADGSQSYNPDCVTIDTEETSLFVDTTEEDDDDS